MTTAIFRFYAELNELLPLNKQFSDQTIKFNGRQTVKHLIESQGIPHTEVDLILANSQPVGFDHIPLEGEHISVYPVFESFDIALANHLRPKPLREPKFVLDGHLGRLASYLRMLGFDSSYRNDFRDEELAEISVAEARILITRDRGLLKRDMVTHGFLVKSRDPKQQLFSVVKRFDLARLISPFTRCLSCNGVLEQVEKEEIVDQIEPKTKEYFEKFKRCPLCCKVYWAGSHHKKMSNLIEWIIQEVPKI